MALRIKASTLVFILAFIICLVSSGIVESLNNSVKSTYMLRKDGMKMNLRKLLGHDQVMDYDYTGPNPKHDPRKGYKPGKGP